MLQCGQSRPDWFFSSTHAVGSLPSHSKPFGVLHNSPAALTGCERNRGCSSAIPTHLAVVCCLRHAALHRPAAAAASNRAAAADTAGSSPAWHSLRSAEGHYGGKCRMVAAWERHGQSRLSARTVPMPEDLPR